MKVVVQLMVFALTLLLVLGAGERNCFATIVDPFDGSGMSITLIDGTEDGNTSVTFNVNDYGAPGDLYYSINKGDWIAVPWSGDVAELSGEGGDLLDFRLDVGGDGEDDDDLYSYNSTEAELTYSGGIPASYAENPTRSDPFYRTVMVDWIGLAGSFKLEILVSQDVHDGFAAVPVPSSCLLLGSGLLGLIRLHRRKQGRHV
jgi:hypothetical protein